MIKYIKLVILSLCTIASLTATIEHITTRNQLAKVLISRPAIIKFSSKNCGPCRASKAMFENLSNREQYKDILFIEVDVDQGNPIALDYNIKGIPAFVFISNSKVVDSLLGYTGKETENSIVKKLEKLSTKQSTPQEKVTQVTRTDEKAA